MFGSTIFLTAAMTLAPGAGLVAPYVTAYEDDGMVTVNGQRTLVLGTYYYTTKYADVPREAALKELADAGFNLVRSDGSKEELDAIHAAGLMAWVTVGTLDLAKLEESTSALKANVAAVKDHPAVAFLETVDEPAWTWKSPDTRIPAEALVRAYPIIREIAPGFLLYTNHAPTNLVKTMRAYNDGTDIVAMDIYPVNPGGLREQYALFEDGYQGDLNNIYISQVGGYVDKMREVAGPNRPLFMVLQGFAWEMLRKEEDRDESKVLYPTYEQTRFMAYQSLIKGANGIIYWGTHYTPQPSECWDGIKRVVTEISECADPLAGRTAATAIEFDYHEMGHSVDDGIQWMAKEHEDSLYLFTCNADKNLHKATIHGLDTWKTCHVLHENRELPIEGAAVTDEWPAFSVHVYRLDQ